jgi:hypothetical protein
MKTQLRGNGQDMSTPRLLLRGFLTVGVFAVEVEESANLRD